MTRWFDESLICPDCSAALDVSSGARCQRCQFFDPSNRDLRLRNGRSLQMQLPRTMLADPTKAIGGIDTSHPEITYAGPMATRDSRELMSEVALRLPRGGRVLDLGCGPRDQAPPLEYLGFKYVGVDYSNSAADLLVDAHSLPFADSTFDCVFSYAVFEHLHNPFVAFSEVVRVLKPRGWFIGTVSQGEPFHSSYFHHTLWALFALENAVPAMRLMRAWDSMDTIESLSAMGRYPRVTRTMLGYVDWLHRALPWLAPRRMKWPERERQIDRLHSAGSICFSYRRA